MHCCRWFPTLILILALFAEQTCLGGPFCCTDDLDRLNGQLAGHILDFTDNHGRDRRIWSRALCQRRDLYVYLPPGYDGMKCFPVMLWMHGFAEDEASFFRMVPHFDGLIRCGQLPPLVIAAVDGTISGERRLFSSGSFYLNSDAGRFEDYVIRDVYPFVRNRFQICPESEAHILAGVSMGGFGAYNLGIKHRREFAHVVGIFPPVNVRYLDCQGKYSGDYDPNCFRLRTRYRPREPIGRFYGVIVLRERLMMEPLFGSSQNPIVDAARENPYEMLCAYKVRPGELNMYVGYGSEDEFNLDAQIESFVDRAHAQGLSITVEKKAGGRHSFHTAVGLLPGASRFISEQLSRDRPIDSVK